MDNAFNDLFNQFLKRLKTLRNTPEQPLDEKRNILRDEIQKMVDMISNVNSIDELTEQEWDKNLGKPDKTEFYEQDGLFYEKRTWHTPAGDMVKVLISDDPSLLTPPKPEKTLKQQLAEAVENEEYEKAAAIRDKINTKSDMSKKRADVFKDETKKQKKK